MFNDDLNNWKEDRTFTQHKPAYDARHVNIHLLDQYEI